MGGSTVRRAAAAKVAGIVSLNAGLRGFRAPSASQSLVHNAAAASASSPALSAQGGCEEEVTAAPVALPWNQGNIDDWEGIRAVVERVSGEPMPRVVCGGAPSFEEAKAAANELKDAIDKVYLSKSKDKVAESVDSAVSSVATDTEHNLGIQAFKFLSQNSVVQDVVASIASDPNVWDAFWQNEALKDFLGSQNSGIQFPLMDLKPEESVNEASSEHWKSPTKLELSDESNSINQENHFINILQNVKITVVELVSSVSGFLQKLFSPPASEKPPANDATAGLSVNEKTFGASFMGLVLLVIMVVLLKRV